eukprot:763915-Hanusia_phi.AAC.1
MEKLLQNKPCWGRYHAEYYNTGTLPDSSGNNRDATKTAGTVTLTTGSGSGAAANISYIYGDTAAKMAWPSGSIPTNFTVCSVTKYNGANKQRILQCYPSSGTPNWLHGHWRGFRGVAFYDGWKTPTSNTGTDTDWLVCCGRGNASGGVGGGVRVIKINDDSELSDWAFTQLFIWDQHLTDAEIMGLIGALLDKE